VPEIPEKRQSIRPPRSMLLAAAVIGIALLAVWFAVGAAVGGGGEDCPAQGNETTQGCR